MAKLPSRGVQAEQRPTPKNLAFAHLSSDFKVPSSLYRAPNSLRAPTQRMVENEGKSGGGPERKQAHSYSRAGYKHNATQIPSPLTHQEQPEAVGSHGAPEPWCLPTTETGPPSPAQPRACQYRVGQEQPHTCCRAGGRRIQAPHLILLYTSGRGYHLHLSHMKATPSLVSEGQVQGHRK